MTSRSIAMGLLCLIVMSLLAGCAAGPNQFKDSPDDNGSVAGFWLGLWHGAVLPITLLISLFSDSVNIYAVHNSGGWYNFGFLLGAAIVWGGGGAASRE